MPDTWDQERLPAGDAKNAETPVVPVQPLDPWGNVIMGGGGAGGGSAMGTYQGSSAVESGDFEVAYLAATQLTLSELPFHVLFENLVAVYEYDGDNLINSYLISDTDYDWTWTPGADKAGGVLTLTGAAFDAASTFVVQLTGPVRDMAEVMTDFGGPYTHQSPRDFDVVYASATTLTIGGVTPMAMSPNADDFRAVVELDAAGRVRMVYTRRKWAMTWAAGGAGTGVLTIATATMQAGSSWIVFVEGPEHSTKIVNAAGAVTDRAKIVQHQDITGGILRSLSSLATAGFVKLVDGTLDLLLKLASTAPTASTVVVPTQPVDRQGNVITGGGGTSGGLGLYSSPSFFTVARNAATELDLTGTVVALITDFRNFVSIKDFDATGAFVAEYKPQTHAFSWDAANSRVTVTGATFTAGGSWVVEIQSVDRFGDLPGNFLNTANVDPYELHGDDGPVALLAAAQDFTAGWIDLGPEIGFFGYNKLKLWLTFDINDSLDLRVRVLEKHTSAGAEEYPSIIESPGASAVLFEGGYWELNVDADLLHPLVFKGDGVTPYLQVQIMAGTLGAGTDAQIDAAYYTRGVI